MYTEYGFAPCKRTHLCFSYVSSGLHHLKNMFENAAKFHAIGKNKALGTIISCFVQNKQKNPELSRQGKGVCQINL